MVRCKALVVRTYKESQLLLCLCFTVSALQNGAQVVWHSPPSFTKHPLLSWADRSKVSKVQRRGWTALSDGLVYQPTNCCLPWCFFLLRLKVWVSVRSKVEKCVSVTGGMSVTLYQLCVFVWVCTGRCLYVCAWSCIHRPIVSASSVLERPFWEFVASMSYVLVWVSFSFCHGLDTVIVTNSLLFPHWSKAT